VTNDTATMAGAMQTVLQTIEHQTDDLVPALLNLGLTEGLGTLNRLTTEVRQGLDGVISALNTRLGDRSLFAGIAADQPALANADTILTALDAAISASGAVTIGEIDAAVTTWFADPAGFSSVGYLGGEPLSPLYLSPEDQVQGMLTAAHPALRDTLKGMALVALADRAAGASGAGIRMALARRGGETLLQNRSDRAALAADLGMAEARIEAAATRNQAEKSALELARNGLLVVDPFEAATRMEATQSQLEALYAVTARLSRLNLVDFLR